VLRAKKENVFGLWLRKNPLHDHFEVNPLIKTMQSIGGLTKELSFLRNLIEGRGNLERLVLLPLTKTVLEPLQKVMQDAMTELVQKITNTVPAAKIDGKSLNSLSKAIGEMNSTFVQHANSLVGLSNALNTLARSFVLSSILLLLSSSLWILHFWYLKIKSKRNNPPLPSDSFSNEHNDDKS